MNLYPWHEALWQRVENAFNANRFPHAVLLWGQAGLGKQDFAKKLIARLMCDSSSACGQCQSCCWVSANTHPDLMTVEAEDGKKQIGIEQIRQLQSAQALSSVKAGARVIWIPKAELLNIAANNALLKILEEPNDNVYYILNATSLATIPITIQSRCHQYYFAAVSDNQIKQYLISHGFEPQYSTLLHGAPLQASTYLSDDAMTCRTELKTSLNLLIEGQKSPCLVAAKWAKQDLNQVLQFLCLWFLDVLKIKQIGNNTNLTNGDSKALLIKHADFMQENEIVTIIDTMMQFLKQQALGRQINQALWLDDLAITIGQHQLARHA